VVQPAIGIDESETAAGDAAAARVIEAPHFLFVGRLLYWKGLHLALHALARARRSIPDVRLKIIGSGEDRGWLEAQARAAGVMDLVEWISSTPHDEITREYGRSLALVFPSLHDSGGMVVLEALAAGLPVVCLDLGGPGLIATPDCALVVAAREVDQAGVVEALAAAMIRIATDAGLRARLAGHAVHRVREFTWDRAADHLYGRFVCG
jgi:glycosyltransferase involved in cell wall biosynthesis